MKLWLKRLIVFVLLVAGIAGSLITTGLLLGEKRMTRRADIAVAPLALGNDSAAVSRGHYLFNSRGCANCHGANGGGIVFEDNGKDLKFTSTNITTGNPRIAAYQREDWVRSIRHGVGPGGRVLRIMPSQDYNRLTDDDLASIISYIAQLTPQSGNENASLQFPLIARVMYGFGRIPEAVTKIDHSLPPALAVPEGVTREHGAYVANMCIGCHGADLKGGLIPGGPPDWPPAARLAPGKDSAMDKYTDAASFVAMMRNGKRADGSSIAVMPFSSFKEMNDTDLLALHLYLSQPDTDEMRP